MKLFRREKKTEYDRGRPKSSGGDRRNRILNNRRTFRGLDKSYRDEGYYDEDSHVPSGVSDDSFLEFDYDDFYDDDDYDRGPEGLKNSRYMEADEFRAYLDTRNTFGDMGYDRDYVRQQRYYRESPYGSSNGRFEDEYEEEPERETDDYYRDDEPEVEEDRYSTESSPFAVAEKNRRLKRSKIKKAGIVITLAVVVVVAAVAGLIYVDKKGLVNIEKIVVNGNSHYEVLDIIDSAKAKTDVGLVTVRTAKMEKRLEKLPYVKSAGVSREFPHTLVININERVPAYAVYFGGFYLILDSEFNMLEKANEAGKLIILEGYVPVSTELGETFTCKNERSMEITMRMLENIKELGLNVYKMSYKSGLLNVYFSKTIMVEGTYDNIMAYIKEINEILYSLRMQEIERGTIHVGDNGYISFSPII